MTAGAAAQALEAALRGISAASLGATCGHCWGEPGQPCTTALPGGTHGARYARAARKGLITSADLALVLDVLGGFSEASVLYEARSAALCKAPGRRRAAALTCRA